MPNTAVNKKAPLSACFFQLEEGAHLNLVI